MSALIVLALACAQCTAEHAAMGHCTAEEQEEERPQSGTDLPAGLAEPPPAPPEANAADAVWGADAMAPVRRAIRREHGGMSFRQIMVDIAEAQFRNGREGYRWDAEGWFGGDIHRLVVTTEGEGDFGGGTESAEVQARYSRAIGPYFNLQAGVRHDIRPTPDRTYAVFGVEGLAPYWFEVELHGFVSTRGDLLARGSASYDQRITQRLILQPRIELNLSAQDMPQIGLGSGLTDAEFDLRLRYEIRREFAPYMGISWERSFGETRRMARMDGRDTGGLAAVVGIRAWF
ncbi:copper resistance protein B [Sphingomonas sp.]